MIEDRLVTHEQLLTVFHRGSKGITTKSSICCFFCNLPIPAGCWVMHYSGYGSHVDVTRDKDSGPLHRGCWKRIARSKFLLRFYVHTTRPTPEMLETEIARSGTVEQLLSERELVWHGSGCLLVVGKSAECRPRKKVRGSNVPLARVLFQRAGFTIERGNVVKHACDVSICVNLAHLIQGTRSENTREAFTRGRHTRYEGLTPCEKVQLTLADRLERLQLYGNPDWCEEWAD